MTWIDEPERRLQIDQSIGRYLVRSALSLDQFMARIVSQRFKNQNCSLVYRPDSKEDFDKKMERQPSNKFTGTGIKTSKFHYVTYSKIRMTGRTFHPDDTGKIYVEFKFKLEHHGGMPWEGVCFRLCDYDTTWWVLPYDNAKVYAPMRR